MRAKTCAATRSASFDDKRFHVRFNGRFNKRFKYQDDRQRLTLASSDERRCLS
jgi:hypothetical protein